MVSRFSEFIEISVDFQLLSIQCPDQFNLRLLISNKKCLISITYRDLLSRLLRRSSGSARLNRRIREPMNVLLQIILRIAEK